MGAVLQTSSPRINVASACPISAKEGDRAGPCRSSCSTLATLQQSQSDMPQ